MCFFSPFMLSGVSFFLPRTFCVSVCLSLSLPVSCFVRSLCLWQVKHVFEDLLLIYNDAHGHIPSLPESLTTQLTHKLLAVGWHQKARPLSVSSLSPSRIFSLFLFLSLPLSL